MPTKNVEPHAPGASHGKVLLEETAFSAAVQDVKNGILTGQSPEDPIAFRELRDRLGALRDTLPPLYRSTFYDPYVAELDRLGASGFNRVLFQDPSRERQAGLLVDIAHAILQNGEGFEALATDAFQEVIADLYDGFLSAEDRRDVEPPDDGVIPPLVKWGRSQMGPYTWPPDATAAIGVDAGVVSLPPGFVRRGLLAYASLGHEGAGHDILHGDKGLLLELARAVREAHGQEELDEWYGAYWATKIDETASDVMGILNMGPAAGVGLIGLFRGLNAAWGSTPHLRNSGSPGDAHPVDVLRGYLAAGTTAILSTSQAAAWEAVINAETDKDLRTIRIGTKALDPKAARASAYLTARTIATHSLTAIEGHALRDIQDWRDEDDQIVERLRAVLRSMKELPMTIASGYYAAHVVSAAVLEAISDTSARLDVLQERMMNLLKSMHDANPSWGPLFVQSRGGIYRHEIYIPQAEQLR